MCCCLIGSRSVKLICIFEIWDCFTVAESVHSPEKRNARFHKVSFLFMFLFMSLFETLFLFLQESLLSVNQKVPHQGFPDILGFFASMGD